MTKRIIKLVSLCAALVLVLAVLCSCGGVAVAQKPAMQEPSKQVEIKGTCTITQNGDTVDVVAHCSDLKDGIVMRISVDAPNGKMLANTIVYKNGDDFMQTFTVGSDWPEQVMGNVVCVPKSLGEQPEEIRGIYGETFEYMTGDNIVYNQEGNALVLQSETITLQK